MRLFPYRYEMQIGNNKAIFHPLNMAVLYCNKNMSEKEIIRNVKNQKQFNDWLVDDDFSYDQYVKNYIKGDSTNIDIKTLKMFITTRCNLDCSYCLIEENLKDRCKEAKDLSLENAIDILEKFSDVCCKQKASPRTIMLYGGEPMMNVGTLKKIIQFIRKKESEGGFNGQVELVLESNGTLITDEIADFLKDNNVFIIVSIDGIKEVHDCYRQKNRVVAHIKKQLKDIKF